MLTTRTMSRPLRKAIKLAVSRRQNEDFLAERAGLADRIRERAEGGVIAIVYGGMDCDCSRWDDRVALVPALPVAVVRWIDRYHEGAEGPQWTRLCAPSQAPERSSSRDLALEAFEDGHPHSITY